MAVYLSYISHSTLNDDITNPFKIIAPLAIGIIVHVNELACIKKDQIIQRQLNQKEDNNG